MAFFVYLFVLVVAAGSVIFGLDLTQSPLQPPPYAAPVAHTAYNPTPNIAPAKVQRAAASPAAAAAPVNAAAAAPIHAATAAPVNVAPPAAPAKVAADAAPAFASRAQANTEDAKTEQAPVTTASMSAPNHCAIDACSAAYRSFRASDCTYQPFDGSRRFCAKTASSAAPARKVAAARASAHHVSRSSEFRRGYDRTYAERDDYRDSYAQPRRSWATDLFGDAFGR
jgi:hypothetical protein